ncbi:MAG: SelB C-terminal domain-containing protein, partial [Actinomycetota bacterium]|nr:SelB C-terminal domain-containing protein [Actinomycetota bacterium]
VRRDHLERVGVVATPARDVRSIGAWLVHDSTWTSWLDRTPGVLDTLAAIDLLEPAPTLGALRRALRLPDDPVLVATLLGAAGLEVSGGRVVRPVAAPSLLVGVPGLAKVVERLHADPFDAPERDELDALGLGRRQLAAAVKAGVLLRVSPDIVLLPGAVSQAVDLLQRVPQPFTTSAARQALGTTRRVAIPLLEHLDTLGLTERVDGSLRRLT